MLPLLLVTALALPPDQSATYDVRVGGQAVGTRTMKVHWTALRDRVVRDIETFTELRATVAGVSYAWRQRLTITAGPEPASFHSVVDENGSPREVQGRWDPITGWTITTVTRRQVSSRDVPSQYVDLSTADLMDPGAGVTLLDLDHAFILAAESGDVWEGDVSPLGAKVLTLGGQEVPVQGVRWQSPEGPTEFWYSGSGWLVQYRMRVLGFEVEGLLRGAPPPDTDEFPVSVGHGKVEVSEL